MANHFEWMGRFEEARQLNEQGLAMLPNYLNLQRNRAVDLLHLNRVDEAEQVLRDLVLDAAQRQLDTLFATRSEPFDLLEAATSYLAAGYADRAAPLLAQAFQRETACVAFVRQSPRFAPYRTLTPVQSLLAKYPAGR